MRSGAWMRRIWAASALNMICTRNTESPAALEPEQAPMMPSHSATTIGNEPQTGKSPSAKPVEDMIETRLKSASRNAGSSACGLVAARHSATAPTPAATQPR